MYNPNSYKKCHSMNHINTVKYMDINSSFRNRNTYPNPCDFVMPYRTSKEYRSEYFFDDPVLTSTPYTAASSYNPPLQTQPGSTLTSIILDPRETTIPNYYILSYLEINGEYREIVQYNGNTLTATVLIPFTVSTVGVNYTIRKSIPTLVSNINIANLDTNNLVNGIYLITTPPPASIDSYNSLYFRFTNGSLENSYCKITEYNPDTQIATIVPSVSQNSFLGGGLDEIEISQYTEENSRYIMYRTLGPPNVRYYELTLEYLLLPNLLVEGLRGGLLDNYPFVYVHIYNDGFQQSVNILYSNNMNSNQALFKVPIDKNLYNRPTNFYTLKPTTQKQIIAFNPVQDLRFRIALPSGLTLKYTTPDTQSPFKPNPLVQVSAFVSIRPVENYDINTC